MFYEEIKIKQFLSYIAFWFKDSLQEQIHFNGNIFESKCFLFAARFGDLFSKFGPVFFALLLC